MAKRHNQQIKQEAGCKTYVAIWAQVILLQGASSTSAVAQLPAIMSQPDLAKVVLASVCERGLCRAVSRAVSNHIDYEKVAANPMQRCMVTKVLNDLIAAHPQVRLHLPTPLATLWFVSTAEGSRRLAAAEATHDLPASQTTIDSKTKLDDACATIMARAYHEEATRVAGEYADELDEISNEEAAARLDDLRTLLYNLGITEEDMHDVFPWCMDGHNTAANVTDVQEDAADPSLQQASAEAEQETPIVSYKSVKIVAGTPVFRKVGQPPKCLPGILPVDDFRGKAWALYVMESGGPIDVEKLYDLLATELKGVMQGLTVALETQHSAVVIVSKHKFKNIKLAPTGFRSKQFSIGAGAAKRAVEVVQHVLANCMCYKSSLKAGGQHKTPPSKIVRVFY